MARTIVGSVTDSLGRSYDGVPVTVWLASRFGAGHPVLGDPTPSGAADAGPVSSGPPFGSDGAFVVAGAPNGDCWVHALVNGTHAWTFAPVPAGGGTVTSVSAADATILVGGTASDPTVRFNNPMTTAGDLIVGGAAGSLARLAKGADNQVLTVDPVTHLLSYKTAGAGGTPPLDNESQASALVNATSVGDAGGRADHFLGNALGPQWTNVLASQSQTVGYSSLGFRPPNGLNTVWAQPFTPSGAFRLEARVGSTLRFLNAGAGHGPNIRVANDITGADPNGSLNWVAMEWNGSALLSQQTAGVYAEVQETFGRTDPAGNPGPSYALWAWIRLERDGANNFSAFFSYDRSRWVPAGTLARALTVNYLLIAGFVADASAGSHFFDCVDVVS